MALGKKELNKQNQIDAVAGHAAHTEMEMYANQYDPNNDFAIFQVGNDAAGGVQSLKEKMNVADQVNSTPSSSESDQTAQQQPAPKPGTAGGVQVAQALPNHRRLQTDA